MALLTVSHAMQKTELTAYTVLGKNQKECVEKCLGERTEQLKILEKENLGKTPAKNSEQRSIF